MAMGGFGFTKINVEKKKNITGKININNNVIIKEIEKADIPFGKLSQPVIKFTFEYKSEYSPDVGFIILEGTILDVQDEKSVNEVVNRWKKDKKITPEVLSPIINSVLSRCNVESLILGREVNLPPSVPLPKVEVRDSSSKK